MYATPELIEVFESLREAMKAEQWNLVNELKAELIEIIPVYGTWTYDVGGSSFAWYVGRNKRGYLRVQRRKAPRDAPVRPYQRRKPDHGMSLKEVAKAMDMDLDQAEELMLRHRVLVNGHGSARWVRRGEATRAVRKELGLPESTVPDSTLFTTRNTSARGAETVRSSDGTAESPQDHAEAPGGGGDPA